MDKKTARHSLRHIGKRINWTDVITFVFFLLFASALWIGHAMRSVRNTRVPVLVSYTGAPRTIGFGGSGLPDTVMIEVRDAGQRLSSYKREPLRLTIDLHPYIHNDKGTIHIPSDALRRSLSDILQGTSRLIATTPEEISCPYYTEKEKTVSVALSGEWIPAAEYQIAQEPTLSITRIHIYGQSAELDAIDTIWSETLHLTELKDTVSMRIALSAPKHIRLETDSIDVCFAPEKFTEKKVNVPLRVEGVPEGYHIRLFPREVEVSIRMGISHFGDVTPGDIKAVCKYSPEQKDKLEVLLQYSNPYITGAWAYPGTVEFILEQ